MFSKPLFKQSCKANAGIWTFTTVITCFMLAIIVIVLGNLNVAGIRDSMVDMFVKDAIVSTTEKQSMSYYNITEHSLVSFEENRNNLNYLLNVVFSDEEKAQITDSYDVLTSEPYNKTDEEAKAVIVAGKTDEESSAIISLINYYKVQGSSYTQNSIDEYVLRSLENEIYDQLVLTEGEETATYSKQFIHQAVTDFLSSGSDNAAEFATNYIPNVLKTILITQSFDYQGRTLKIADYFNEDELGDKSLSAIISYKANLTVKEETLREEISNNHPELSPAEKEALLTSSLEEYKTVLIGELSNSLLDDLPSDIANALTELGGLDISSLVIGNIFFKMAGLLLPIVYIIMASNNLVASQVDSGSMAYVLSTPTKRRTVSLTQILYLVVSLFAMFACTTIVGLVCLAIVGNAQITITLGEMALLNLGAFITMIAIAGICFLASSWFNRSKLALSVGGGLSMFFLVATILGLFGSKVIPSAMRIDAMNYFNYFSLISLFDGISIMAGTTTFIWKLAILLGVAIAGFTVSVIKFKKKDLPL